MHEFGQFYIVRREHTQKLDNRGVIGRWLGLDNESKGNLVWINNKIQSERNLQFIAGKPTRIEGEKISNKRPLNDENEPDNAEHETRKSTRPKIQTKRAQGLNYDEQSIDETKEIKRKKGLNYKDEINMAIYLSEFNDFANEILDDPLTFGEAVNRIDKDLWIEAMNEEIRMLKKHHTWVYTYPPKGANVIGTRFVYKIKRLANGEIDKYKARLVVQGYAQKLLRQGFVPCGNGGSGPACVARGGSQPGCLLPYSMTGVCRTHYSLWSPPPLGVPHGSACRHKPNKEAGLAREPLIVA